MRVFKRLNDDGRRKADEESDDGDVSVDICTVHISLQKKKNTIRFSTSKLQRHS